ncbi:MAG: RidA family protein [Armatimonadetes bacterium]|nr:RidA family protein [Armatimonadota bacterium]
MKPVLISEVPGLATPKGHYSPATMGAGLVAISGQLPLDAQGQPVLDSFESEVRAVFANIDLILATVGCTRDSLFQVTVYVTSLSLWPEFNRLYAEWVGDHKPARAVVPVPELNYGAHLEIAALALAP